MITNLNQFIHSLVPGNYDYYQFHCIGDGSCLFHAMLVGLCSTYLKSYEIMYYMNSWEELEVKNPTLAKDFCDLIDDPKEANKWMKLKYRNSSLSFLMEHYRHLVGTCFRKKLSRYIQEINNPLREIVEKIFEGKIDMYSTMYQAEKKIPKEISDKLAKNQVFYDICSELESGEAVSPEYLILIACYTNVNYYLIRMEDLKEVAFIDSNSNSLLYGGDSFHMFNQNEELKRTMIILYTNYHYDILLYKEKDSTRISSLFPPNHPLSSFLKEYHVYHKKK